MATMSKIKKCKDGKKHDFYINIFEKWGWGEVTAHECIRCGLVRAIRYDFEEGMYHIYMDNKEFWEQAQETIKFAGCH